MISLTKVVTVTWIIAGFVGLVWGTKALSDPANKQKLKEHIQDIANETKITEEDFLCILYVAFFTTGIIGVTLSFYRKFRNYIRRRWGV